MHSSIHHLPLVIHHPSSIICHPPSTIHHPLSTIHHQSFIIHRPSAITHSPWSIAGYLSSTFHHPPSIVHYALSIFLERKAIATKVIVTKVRTSARVLMFMLFLIPTFALKMFSSIRYVVHRKVYNVNVILQPRNHKLTVAYDPPMHIIKRKTLERSGKQNKAGRKK